MKLHFVLLEGSPGQGKYCIRGGVTGGTGTDLQFLLPLEATAPGRWEGSWTDDLSGGRIFHYRYYREEGGIRVGEEHAGRSFMQGEHACGHGWLVDRWCDPGDPYFAFFKAPFRSREWSPPPSLPACRVTEFRVRALFLEKGSAVRLLGSTPALGSWDPARPVAMTEEGGEWVARVVFPAGTEIAYKYAIYRSAGDASPCYEEGPDRHIRIDVHDKACARVSDSYVRAGVPRWKGAGVAVPVFSLRSGRSGGIGEFCDLKLLADWASAAGLRLLQLLPVNDTAATGTWRDSYPYSAISAFALNPAYLRLDAVGMLPEDFPEAQTYETTRRTLNALREVDYEAVLRWKWAYLRALFPLQQEAFLCDAGFRAFFRTHREWLVPYAVFCYLRDLHGTADNRRFGRLSLFGRQEVEAFAAPDQPQYAEIAIHYFVQYHLHLQLSEAAAYARDRGLALKGDIPIGIGRHSADAWQHPEAFFLDMQSGAPPDDFAPRGQNWGFPTYRWEIMEADGYRWWKARLRHLAEYFDVIRFDHILGFFRIWQIPAEAVEGVLGHFQPALPLAAAELKARFPGFPLPCDGAPRVADGTLAARFGADAAQVRSVFFEPGEDGLYRFRACWSTQRKIADAFTGDPPSYPERWKAPLLALASERLFLPADPHGHFFHPRFRLTETDIFQALPPDIRDRLRALHDDYFYVRHEAFWREEALRKLPALKEASRMLLCGEDLGLVPDTVPATLEQLGLLSLEVQRMPKQRGAAFTDLSRVPYLSVVTPATHDMSPLRLWWKEDAQVRRRYYHEVLGSEGEPPAECDSGIVARILEMHFRSPAMWAVVQLQDLFALYEPFRREDAASERINIPANPEHCWSYRMHISLEALLEDQAFAGTVRRLVLSSGRDGKEL